MRKMTLSLVFLCLALLLVPSYGTVAPKPTTLSTLYGMALKNSKPLIQLEIDQGLAIKKRNELALKIELASFNSEVDLTSLRMELEVQNASLEANERYYRSQKEALWTQVSSLYMQLLREGLSEQIESERSLAQTLQLPKIYNDYLSGFTSKEAYNAAKEELQGTKLRMEQSAAVQIETWKKLNALTGQKMSKDNAIAINPNLYKFEAPTTAKLSAAALKADYELYQSGKDLEKTLKDLKLLMTAYQDAFGEDAVFMKTFEEQSPVDYNILFPLYKDFLAKEVALDKPEEIFQLPEAFKGSDYPLIDALVAREKAKDRVKTAQTQASLNLDLAVNQYNLKLKNYELSLKTLTAAEAEYKQLETLLMIGKINSTQITSAANKKRNLVYDKDLKYLDLYEASAQLAKLLGQF